MVRTGRLRLGLANCTISTSNFVMASLALEPLSVAFRGFGATGCNAHAGSAGQGLSVVLMTAVGFPSCTQ